MERDQLEHLLAALCAGTFEVETKGPDGITQHFNYAGEPFLRISGSEVLKGRRVGTCTVHVLEHCFVCDLLTGEWRENDIPLNSAKLIHALENTEGIVFGEHFGIESQIRLYALIHGLPSDINYCWAGEEGLKEVSDLGQGEVSIVVRYTVKDEGGWDELEASVDDGQLYQLYRLLRRGNRLPQGENEIEVSSEEIEKYVPELYADIIEQIEGEFSIDEEYCFSLPLTHEILDATLYGENIN